MFFIWKGLKAGDDLSGNNKPETVKRLYDETNEWMFSK